MTNCLREWREFRGLSQEQLAEAVEKATGYATSKSTVSKHETGARQMSEAWLRRYAKALDLLQPGDVLSPPTVTNARGAAALNDPLTPKAQPSETRENVGREMPLAMDPSLYDLADVVAIAVHLANPDKRKLIRVLESMMGDAGSRETTKPRPRVRGKAAS